MHNDIWNLTDEELRFVRDIDEVIERESIETQIKIVMRLKLRMMNRLRRRDRDIDRLLSIWEKIDS